MRPLLIKFSTDYAYLLQTGTLSTPALREEKAGRFPTALSVGVDTESVISLVFDCKETIFRRHKKSDSSLSDSSTFYYTALLPATGK